MSSYAHCLSPIQQKAQEVTVKLFIDDSSAFSTKISVKEKLGLSKEPENFFYAYKEIRQEMSFLSSLNHPNIIKFYGVKTSPYMCLVTEIPPLMNLRQCLDEHKKYGVVLEPITMIEAALQVFT